MANELERLRVALADRYQLERELGRGGMATVYLAQDIKHDRPVALKVLKPELAAALGTQRFLREIRIAARLNHPSILPLHDSGEANGFLYYVMPYVEGESLRGRLKREKQLPLDDALQIAREVADALNYAHSHDVLHRDIKPENILLHGGHAVVADFGIARAISAAGGEQLTATGLTVGTPPYMSPEQAIGDGELDARSDIYSLGCVVYEMLGGDPPFTGSSAQAILARKMVDAPPGLRTVRETVPEAVEEVILKALAKAPADRFVTATQFADALVRAHADGAVRGGRRFTALKRALLADTHSKPRGRLWWIATGAGTAVLIAALVMHFRSRTPDERARLEYTQLTNFAESATSPALSPDGRMLAFILGERTSFGPGEIYVKLLPDGEPVQLTHDNRSKMRPKFSPDGARIGYTVFAEGTLDTWVVPVLGGQPRLFLTNASGLTWIQERNMAAAGQPVVLFSEFTGRGNQMSIVSSTESRTEQRNVYIPPETGMAHHSYLSPDRKQVLVVEMNLNSWLPCRLTPFDGSSPGKPVGPAPAQCTDAAWSPDGKWMYFSANTGSGVHTWRQRFPDGTPEQVTFGVTEEEGIAFAADGRSFVTSIGTSQSTVWVHDSRGDRQVTREGYAFLPSVSPDAKKLYYLVRAGGARNFVTGGLWVVDLESGQRRRLLPDFQMGHYAISADGQRVVFVAVDDAGRTPVWLAALNGRSAPRRLTAIDSYVAYFGAGGSVVFAGEEKGANFVYRMKDDGSELRKMLPTPNLAPFGVSPDGRLVSAETPTQFGATMVYPAGGGSPTLVCGSCNPPQGTDIVPSRLSWTPDGRFLYLIFAGSTYAIPLRPGQVLPPVPASGFQSKEAVAALPGARLVSEESVWPGPDPSVYAFTKVSRQGNIYRVPVP